MLAAFESCWGMERVGGLLPLTNCPEVCFCHWYISMQLYRVTRDGNYFCLARACQVLKCLTFTMYCLVTFQVERKVPEAGVIEWVYCWLNCPSCGFSVLLVSGNLLKKSSFSTCNCHAFGRNFSTKHGLSALLSWTEFIIRRVRVCVNFIARFYSFGVAV